MGRSHCGHGQEQKAIASALINMNTEEQQQMPSPEVTATAGAGLAEVAQTTSPEQNEVNDHGQDQDEAKSSPDQAEAKAVTAQDPNPGRDVDAKYKDLRPVLVEDDPGHRYMIPLFEKPDRFLLLEFIKKTPDPEDTTRLRTEYDGTTNEAVLEALLMRLRHLQIRRPCQENLEAISGIVHALEALYQRTMDRQSRGVEGRELA
ncbi:MAG TPA: hypothetical protein PKZ07_14500 [Sedimentisphaerales bacterium]|nr:hypothetical protein [Sedimentisphaerales bacterium]